MKNRKRIYVIVAIVLLLAALSVGGYNIFANDSFWTVNVAQVLTLIITISIAFWATQFKNDQRRAKDHAERVIQKVQLLVTADRFYTFVPGVDIGEANKLHNISVRKLSNCIDILKMYGDEFGFKEEIRYIESELKQYKEFVSEHLTDYDYLSKSENQLRRYSENIDSKCDQIIIKLYK